MGVAHLSAQEMAYFNDPARRDPAAVRAEQKLRDYAERTGGVTLEFWKLSLGHVWGQPYIMTMDEVAKRLHRPVSDLQIIDDDTHRALGWGQYAASEESPTHEDHDA